MAYKLNHVLFSRKTITSPAAKKALLGAAVIVVALVLAVNWKDLTQSPIDRFADAYEARRFDEAIAIAEAILLENPESAEAYRGIASAYLQKAILRQGFETSLREALAAARAARDLDSENVEGRRLLGFALELAGDYSGAEAEYRAALDIDPNDALTLASLGGLYGRQLKGDAAAEIFGQAIIIDPTNEELRVLYGRHLMSSGRYDDAAEIANLAASSDSLLYAAEGNRIVSASYLAIGETEKARPYAEKALALAPDSPAAMQNYSQLLFDELFGPYEKPYAETIAEARRLADKSIALDPTSTKAYLTAFKVAYAQQDFLVAREYENKLLAIIESDSSISPEEKGRIRNFLRDVRGTDIQLISN